MSATQSPPNDPPNDSPPPAAGRRAAGVGLRFSLRTIFVLVLLAALLTAWWRDRTRLNQTRRLSTVNVEVYTSRAEFEKRVRALRCIDFDDVDTSQSDTAPFAADRYRDRGVEIRSAGGLYAGRTFGFPQQYPVVSAPNSYAPGPPGKNPGGTTTELTFFASSAPGLVAAFGATFIDADHPSVGASSVTVMGWHDRPLATRQVSGANASHSFVGVIAVDSNGDPVPAIKRVQLVSGTGWPGVDAGDGVTLDDILFSDPQQSGL